MNATDLNRDVGVIIAAAGSGSRFGMAKQFELIGELPLYQFVTRTFSLIGPVRAIVVVGRESDVPKYKQGLAALNPPCDWRVATGGGTRQDSVANGLQALREFSDVKIVLVHDAARALIDDTLILAVIGAIREHGSAVAGLEVVDTLKRVVGGEIVETLSRENIWRAQTPQGARMELMLAAYDQAKTSGFQGTDESQLLERIGEQPRLVPGSNMNFKITYPIDLERARLMVQGQMLRSNHGFSPTA
jgi:2-C-methyl-D-erythritol 4-phosphate cytidylyltransferase